MRALMDSRTYDIHRWTRPELEAAVREMQGIQGEARKVPGEWYCAFVEAKQAERARLLNEKNALNVFIPEGQRRFCEITGEVRQIDKVLSEYFGLRPIIDTVEKEIEKREREGRS
jgi:hypothetical protein